MRLRGLCYRARSEEEAMFIGVENLGKPVASERCVKVQCEMLA